MTLHFRSTKRVIRNGFTVEHNLPAWGKKNYQLSVYMLVFTVVADLYCVSMVFEMWLLCCIAFFTSAQWVQDPFSFFFAPASTFSVCKGPQADACHCWPSHSCTWANYGQHWPKEFCTLSSPFCPTNEMLHVLKKK